MLWLANEAILKKRQVFSRESLTKFDDLIFFVIDVRGVETSRRFSLEKKFQEMENNEEWMKKLMEVKVISKSSSLLFIVILNVQRDRKHFVCESASPPADKQHTRTWITFLSRFWDAHFRKSEMFIRLCRVLLPFFLICCYNNNKQR